jgi:hypothetical protein
MREQLSIRFQPDLTVAQAQTTRSVLLPIRFPCKRQAPNGLIQTHFHFQESEFSHVVQTSRRFGSRLGPRGRGRLQRLGYPTNRRSLLLGRLLQGLPRLQLRWRLLQGL